MHNPARNIMTTAIYDGARSFRIGCDCHDRGHDVDVWVEVEPDEDIRRVTVTFYRDMETPFWQRGFNRFREAWRILVHGRSRFEGDVIMHEETAQEFCDAIQSSIKLLKKK